MQTKLIKEKQKNYEWRGDDRYKTKLYKLHNMMQYLSSTVQHLQPFKISS